MKKITLRFIGLYAYHLTLLVAIKLFKSCSTFALPRSALQWVLWRCRLLLRAVPRRTVLPTTVAVTAGIPGSRDHLTMQAVVKGGASSNCFTDYSGGHCRNIGQQRPPDDAGWTCFYAAVSTFRLECPVCSIQGSILLTAAQGIQLNSSLHKVYGYHLE
jgi:hypothetical protein